MGSIYSILNKALLSDLAVNDSIMKKYNLYNFWGFTIPDALTMHAKAINKRKLLKLGFRFFSYLFPFLYPFVGFLQVLQYYKSLSKVKKNKQVYNISGPVNYALSYRITDMISRIDGSTPEVWLTVPWVKFNSKPLGVCYSIFSDWKIFDLVGAFFVSYFAGLRWYFSSKPKTHLVKSMHSFQWVLTFINLKRINKNISSFWYVNHYGRWTTIVDELAKNKSNVWLQHGLLEESYDPGIRQRNIKTVYTFGKRFESIIEDKILKPGMDVEYITMNTAIELKSIKDNQNPSILFIGQPQSVELDIFIVSQLQKEFACVIYIKPHPLNDQNAYDTLMGVDIIKDKSYFPRVDLAISHSSTLGLEYEASNVKVVWTADREQSDILNEIKHNLQS